VPEVAFVHKHPLPTSVTPFTRKEIQQIYTYIVFPLYCSRARQHYNTGSLRPPGRSVITVVFMDTIIRELSLGIIHNFTLNVILKPREKQHFVHTYTVTVMSPAAYGFEPRRVLPQDGENKLQVWQLT